jgi:hypothetical protein
VEYCPLAQRERGHNGRQSQLLANVLPADASRSAANVNEVTQLLPLVDGRGRKGDQASDRVTERPKCETLSASEVVPTLFKRDMPMSDSAKTASAWAPLGQSVFRSLWIEVAPQYPDP